MNRRDFIRTFFASAAGAAALPASLALGQPGATAGKKKLPKIPHDTTIRVRPKGGGI